MQNVHPSHPSLAARLACAAEQNAYLRALLHNDDAMEQLSGICGHASDACRQTLEAMRSVLELAHEADAATFLRAVYDRLCERMFPLEDTPRPTLSAAETAYLTVLECVLEQNCDEFDPLTDLIALPTDAMANSRVAEEYSLFTRAVAECHYPALMRIGREVQPFDPASHTIGVHNVAVHTALLAAKAGFAVDLPLVSAAALGHDIGKFGCRGADARRIPYLHYYYTWQWFSENHMPEIGHVSANHSTWDLEFENLPVESLLLIYADFRVRGAREADGREHVRVYTLAEAYAIIFSKLSDMTEEKQARYRSVYEKLHDFECLLESRGVPTELSCSELQSADTTDPSLMTAEQALQALCSMTLDGSIRLMHTVSTNQSLEQLLERAKGEKNLQRVRTYLLLLQEYNTYMTRTNKRKTLVLLYELLMHPDGDVRRKAGQIMGEILANSGPKYRKERPASARPEENTPAMSALLNDAVQLWRQYIDLCLYPDRKIAPKHAMRISNSLKTICEAMFASCEPAQTTELLQPLVQALLQADESVCFVLVDAMCHVPCRAIADEDMQALLARAGALLTGGEVRLQMIVLILLLRLKKQCPETAAEIERIARGYTPAGGEDDDALRYARGRLLDEAFVPLDAQQSSRMHLSNLKNAVHWTVKLAQIQMLCRSAAERPAALFHTALHLSNLLSVSEHLPVRESAGEHLLALAPGLSVDQINEICIDLMRELETGQEQIARFIPPYLGRLMCLLPDKELRETVDYLENLARGASVGAAQVALCTLGEALCALPQDNQKIAGQMLGILMTGVSHYEPAVHQTALCVLCRDVFGSARISLARKHEMFVHLHKKLLVILCEEYSGELTFFCRAAMLNHLYRYIVHSEIALGSFRFPAQKPAAFFPGTFDPFSNGHKQIVQQIRALGFEIYLAVDEFSWSKKTLPKLLRRKIVGISVADQADTYLFPDEIPINIANPADLARLKRLLPGREVYLVAGSDVIWGASAYHTAAPGGAADYNHIIFCRNETDETTQQLRRVIRGKLRLLTLPPFYDTVSSTRIRESIDRKLDISMLVDPVVQSFIYEKGLYVRAPEHKNLLQQQELFYRRGCAPDPGQPEAMNRVLRGKASAQAVSLYARPELLVGWIVGHTIVVDELYDALGSIEAAGFVRRHASGRILLVDELRCESSEREQTCRMLLNELLARSLEGGHTYAICRCSRTDEDLRRALSQLGFVTAGPHDEIWFVDMRAPVMLLQDVMLAIKAPHHDAPAVKEAVAQTRPRLRRALNQMFPGKLLLAFDTEMLNQALVERIERINGVQDVPSGQRQLGPYMCVPYGKIFSDEIVPNTVTKTLHVEKCFRPDLRSFEIQEYPGYSKLPNQVRTLGSFGRPVLLVDDLLHKGYRIEKLDKVLRAVGLKTEKIIVAVMSGSGRDLMRLQSRQAECEYFIPNLHYWVTESLLYPFLGGDSVDGRGMQEHMLPSVNLILPYDYPNYFSDVEEASVRALSRTALENAMTIMQVLEQEHQRVFSTALTIRRLGEALQQPRLPDKGMCMRYDFGLPASAYLEEDLARIDKICRKEGKPL